MGTISDLAPPSPGSDKVIWTSDRRANWSEGPAPRQPESAGILRSFMDSGLPRLDAPYTPPATNCPDPRLISPRPGKVSSRSS